MGQIVVQMFFLPLFFLFFFLLIYLFMLPSFRVRRAEETLQNSVVGSGESTQWNIGWLSDTMFCYCTSNHVQHASTTLHTHIFPFIPCFIRMLENAPCVWHCVRHACPILHFILLFTTAELTVAIARASCFLSREWQITPSGSPSLWSPLHVAATIIPCTTFKHIPFALQFVQPGIITTRLNPLAPQPHIAASLWVGPIPGLFCPLQGSILCFLCPVWFYSGKRAKCQSMNRPLQPLAKL